MWRLILLIPIAKHQPTGRLVGPLQVARGVACDCLCLECGSPLIAKQGPVVSWHFSHTGNRYRRDRFLWRRFDPQGSKGSTAVIPRPMDETAETHSGTTAFSGLRMHNRNSA